jgi:hypothetical protein
MLCTRARPCITWHATGLNVPSYTCISSSKSKSGDGLCEARNGIAREWYGYLLMVLAEVCRKGRDDDSIEVGLKPKATVAKRHINKVLV